MAYNFRILVYIAPMIIIFSNCSEKAIETSIDNQQLIITDSIEIDYAAKLKYVDFLVEEQVHLLADIDNTTVLEVDSVGNIRNQFQCGGREEEQIGSLISAIGYIDNNTIGIVSERGIFFFQRNGNLKKVIKAPVKFPSPVYQYLFPYQDEKVNYLIYSCDPFYDYTEKFFSPGDENFYLEYKALTLYDLKSDKKEFIIGFEQESLFMQNQKQPYMDIYNNFLVEDNYLYVLHNPDPNIYVYDISRKFSYLRKILISPENYDRIPDKKDIDMYRTIAINSKFNGLLKDENHLIVTYSSGIPEDIYPKSKLGLNKINELTAQYDRLYVSIYEEGGEKITEDIKAPYEIASLNKRIAPKTFIATPHGGRIEKMGKALFYIVQLNKLDS